MHANPALTLAWRQTEIEARELGITLQAHSVQDRDEIEAAFAAMAHEHLDALIVLQDSLTLQHRREILDFVQQQRLPGIYVAREWVEAGGLVSYGESLPEMYRRLLISWTRFSRAPSRLTSPWNKSRS